MRLPAWFQSCSCCVRLSSLSALMGAVAAFALFFAPLALAPRLLFYFDVTPKVAILLVGAAAAILWFACNLDSLRSYCGTFQGRWFTLAAVWRLKSPSAVLSARALSREAALAWTGSNWRRFGAIPQAGAIAGGWVIAGLGAGERGSIIPDPAGHLRGWRLRRRLRNRASISDGIRSLPASGYEAGEGPFRIVRPPKVRWDTATISRRFCCGRFSWEWGLAPRQIPAGWRGPGWRALGWAASVIGMHRDLVQRIARGCRWDCWLARQC